MMARHLFRLAHAIGPRSDRRGRPRGQRRTQSGCPNRNSGAAFAHPTLAHEVTWAKAGANSHDCTPQAFDGRNTLTSQPPKDFTALVGSVVMWYCQSEARGEACFCDYASCCLTMYRDTPWHNRDVMLPWCVSAAKIKPLISLLKVLPHSLCGHPCLIVRVGKAIFLIRQ